MASPAEPNGGVSWRLGNIERRLDRIDALEPAVMKQGILDLRDDLHDIRDDVVWIKRTFIGFCVTFAFSGITMVLLLTR